MNNSTSLARVIVRQIIEAGITDVVVSPATTWIVESWPKGVSKLHNQSDS
jgi:hypothetical protein